MHPSLAQPIALLSDNYGYLIATPEGGALVVDPSQAAGVEEALERAGRRLCGLLITHHHHDHIGGIDALVAAHAQSTDDAAPQIRDPLPIVASAYDVARCRVPHATHAADDNETLNLAEQHFDVLYVPGHTQGAVAYLWREGGALFTGDTLFLGGCGRLIEGQAEQLYASLLRIRALPQETLIYCGHEYTRKNLAFAHDIEPDNEAVFERLRAVDAEGPKPCTVPASLATERETNCFLRADETKLAKRLGSAPGLETFIKLRQLRDKF